MRNNLLNVDAIPALLYILTVMNILLPIGSGLDKFGSIIKAEIGKCVEVMISSSQIIILFRDQIDRETDHNECTSSANIIFILTMFFFLSRNYIAGKWYGFTDPQSGLHRLRQTR
jgi:hypothetical protein